jgi:phage baseplate assembly protein gpV
MLIKIKDTYAKDDLTIPRNNLIRWYQKDSTVDLFFSDGSALRYWFATETLALTFQMQVSTAWVQAAATNHTIQTTTVAAPEEEPEEVEPEENQTEEIKDVPTH